MSMFQLFTWSIQSVMEFLQSIVRYFENNWLCCVFQDCSKICFFCCTLMFLCVISLFILFVQTYSGIFLVCLRSLLFPPPLLCRSLVYLEGNLETKLFTDPISSLVKRIREIAIRRDGIHSPLLTFILHTILLLNQVSSYSKGLKIKKLWR